MDKPHRFPLPRIDEETFQPWDSAPPPGSAASSADSTSSEDLEKKIVAQLRTCYDPEIPVDIYELGLVYDIDIEPPGVVKIRMTLTSPACPAAGTLPGEVQRKAASVSGVQSAKVDIVWDPPWDPSRMSEAARLQLGLDYD